MKTEEEIRARIDDLNEEIADIRKQDFSEDYAYALLTELYAKRDILRWVLK